MDESYDKSWIEGETNKFLKKRKNGLIFFGVGGSGLD